MATAKPKSKAKPKPKKVEPELLVEESNLGGRPTEYGADVLEAAKAYCNDPLPKGQIIHTVEGLALHLGFSRSTIYRWRSEEDKKEFWDIFDEILTRQGLSLINGGIFGTYNSTITKVMLTKHGYREGIEQSGEGGGPVRVDITDQLTKTYGSPDPVSGDSA